MHCRLACAALLGAVLACTALALARGASALPLCNTGQIVKAADPTLSAPSPTNPGSTITSSGGSWTSCGEAFTGFYKEWLRDGAIVSGPTFVASSPASFTYVVQAADAGHSIRSAVLPCNADGCYSAYASSANAIVPVAPVSPPPPPPPAGPPPPEQLYFDEGFDYTVTDEFGNLVSQQSMDNLPDGSYEISPYGWDRRCLLREHGTAAPGQHHRCDQLVRVGPGRETVLHGRQAPHGARFHHARGCLEVPPEGPLVCHVPRDRGALVGSRLVLLRRRWALPGGLGQSRQPAGGTRGEAA